MLGSKETQQVLAFYLLIAFRWLTVQDTSLPQQSNLKPSSCYYIRSYANQEVS